MTWYNSNSLVWYKRTSFCKSDCSNDECSRHFGKDDKIDAINWWTDTTSKSEWFGNEGKNGSKPPVLFIDFSYDCKEYEKP